MGKKKRGRCARGARKNQNNSEPEEIVKAPHSFVINRGRIGKNGNELMMNFRKVMEPFTAGHLKVQRQNVLKDFVHMAGPMNVSHLIIFTKSTQAMYLRIAKLPHGPTLTFQVKEYCLSKDVVSAQKKAALYEKLFATHPLLVLNNFTGEGLHLKLMATTFQNMFPSINVNKTNLNTIRRCLLLNRNTDDTIELRHYGIKVVPTGMSRAVKKLIQSKVPDLSNLKSMDDYLQKPGNLSESEAEIDTPATTVVLSQPISSRGNIASEKSAIRLHEIGPRIKIQLVKIEDGVMTGEVLFHQFITKTPEEVKALKKKIVTKKKLKASRKELQEKNVEKKKAILDAKNIESREEQAKKRIESSEEQAEEDREWYRKEVGEEPEENLTSTQKRRGPTNRYPRKKFKAREDHHNAKEHKKRKL